MGDFVSYVRVSTAQQGRSGLGLEAQQQMAGQYLTRSGGRLLAEFIEVESGRKNDRPMLQEALAMCRENKATLVIAKLDRLSRNAKFLLALLDSDVKFVCCDMPEANSLTIGILSIVAQHELEQISQRTKEGLRIAKQRGTKLGGMRSEKQKRAAIKATVKKADDHALEVMPAIREIQAAGIDTLGGICKALTARGIKTARNGAWYPTTVRDLIRRAEALA